MNIELWVFVGALICVWILIGLLTAADGYYGPNKRRIDDEKDER